MIWYDMVWYMTCVGLAGFQLYLFAWPASFVVVFFFGLADTCSVCGVFSFELKVRQNVGNEMRSTDAKQSPVRGVHKGGGGSEETVWGLWEGGVIGSASSKCFYCCCCSKLNWGAHVFACLYSNSYSYSYSLFVIRIRYSLAHSLLFVRIHSSCKIVGGSTKRRTERSPKDINKWAKAAREAK